MRFKVIFDEKTKSLEINAIPDGFSDIILPENVDQHVQFPIPDDAYSIFYKQLRTLITEQDTQHFKDLQDNLEQIQTSKRLAMQKLRTELNPKIIELCVDFKENNPEYFI